MILLQVLFLIVVTFSTSDSRLLSPLYLSTPTSEGRFFTPAAIDSSYHHVTPILRYDSHNDESGNYHYAYETGNGIHMEEKGELRGANTPQEANVVHGSFSYTAPDGQRITVTYTADENGFHPQGAHLPTPPPVPEAILRSFAANRVHGDGEFKDY